ncbi:MAG: hypothetical protein J6S04_04360 [Clostridia bacterium]|nr:hypothetical protein [Clostridia bacterium]
MSDVKLKKIVFVCTGNTCRSPMAEYLFKQVLKKEKLRGFKICSAGVGAKKGDVMNPKSVQTLAEHKITVGKFSATPINDKLLKEAFAFVCMTERHADYLMDMRWNVLRKAGVQEIENNVYSFEQLAGYAVPDPYGREIDAYRYVYDLLERGMYAIIEKLDLKQHALPTPQKPAGTGKRGRPKKAESGEVKAPATPKKRGRPKKETTYEQIKMDF